MEEDIEILEQIKESIDIDYGTGRRKVQAIENLINRNKELEQLEREHQKEIEKYKYLYQKALDNTIKSDKELQTLKRDFEIVDHECSRLERKEVELEKEIQKKDKIIDLIVRSFKQDDYRTVEELKEYFEKKAEGK